MKRTTTTFQRPTNNQHTTFNVVTLMVDRLLHVDRCTLIVAAGRNA